MTKNTKIAAIVSAAALLAIGASMTSFAATGWQEEDGTWVYYDKYEDKVTDTWEKSGSNWYYLNDDGEMATDVLIEDDDNYYYVDANGAMVTNNWVEMDNSDDDDEDAPATVWYYFQSNGKAYKTTNSKTSFKTINGKRYAFDEDGKMLWGWVNEDGSRETGDDAWKAATYYCGGSDDGAEMYNSWGQIHVVDDREDDEDQDYWFYFGSNGKKYAYNKTTGGYYEKTINGKKYTFDEYGKMLSAFVASGADMKPSGTNVASVSDGNVKYFRTAEDGARYTKGWFRVVPDKFFDNADSEDEDDNARWFYADGSGKLYNNVIKTINGKKYAFDGEGEMIWGIRYLTFDADGNIETATGDSALDEIDDSDKLDAWTDVTASGFNGVYVGANEKDGLYYFGDEETDGAMKTGSQTVTVDGDTYSFNFKTSGATKGQGIMGKKDNAFYVNGRKIKADSDQKYEIYTYDDADTSKKLTKVSTKDLFLGLSGDTEYVDNDDYRGVKKDSSVFAADYAANGDYAYVVIGTSGQWIKSGTKKDGDDYKIVVKSNKLVGLYYEK